MFLCFLIYEFILGSPEKTSDKVKEDKFGQMVPCTRVGGRTTKPTVREDLFMLMVTFMMANGSMIKLMDSVFTAISMEPNTKVTGRKINNTVMV